MASSPAKATSVERRVVYGSMDSFDMPIVRHEGGVECLRRSRTLVPRAEELPRYDLSVCCVGRGYVCFFLIWDASNGWCMLGSEFRQQRSVRGRRFVGCHILESFGLLRIEQEEHYARKPDGWTRFEKAGVLVVPTAVVYAYLT